MTWNSVVEFHQTIRGDVDPESIRIGAEESCNVFNGWEKEEVKPTKEERRATAAKGKDVASLRKVEKSMKNVGLEGAENGEIKSKRKVKKVANEKLVAGKEEKKAHRVEAQVGDLGGMLKGIGLAGEATKENDPTVTGKSGDSEFGTGSSNLRGGFN